MSQKRSQIQKSFEHRPLLTVNERRKEKTKKERERENMGRAADGFFPGATRLKRNQRHEETD